MDKTSKKRKLRLSVVVPSFNEAKNFKAGVLDELVKYLKEQEYGYEVIFSDDGSSDATVKLLKNFIKGKKQYRILENKHAGKAPTVTAGVLAAKGEYILFTDFDQATPIAEIEKVFGEFEKGADLVIGSREGFGAARKGEPLYRHLMGRVFNLVVKTLTSLPYGDTQCGFKAFRFETVQDLFKSLKVKRKAKDAYTGAFDVELLYLAKKRGFKISQIPVEWRFQETIRINPIKDSWRMFWDVVRIKINDFKGVYS